MPTEIPIEPATHHNLLECLAATIGSVLGRLNKTDQCYLAATHLSNDDATFDIEIRAFLDPGQEGSGGSRGAVQSASLFARLTLMSRVWRPNVTVAAVIERKGRFLIVEEEVSEGLRLNQPAGHLEPDESLIDAVRRETLEETAYQFEPEALVGMYQWRRPKDGVTYLRFTFSGQIIGDEPAADAQLDSGIVRALWLSAEELAACVARHRSPLIMRSLQDWQAGKRFGLDLFADGN